MSLPTASAWSSRLDLKKHGSEFVGPCPLCGGENRFHVRPKRHGCLVGCRGCIDGQIPVIRAERFRQLLVAVFPERRGSMAIAGTKNYNVPRTLDSTPSRGRDDGRASVVWSRSRVADDTPAAAYLVDRRVWPPLALGIPLPADCRWVDSGNWPAARAKRIPPLPADAAGTLAFAYRDAKGNLGGVSCEALTSNGHRCNPRWRRTLGKKLSTWFVTGPGPRCYVEGECDALAAKWLKPGFVGASCGGDAGVKGLRLPNQGERALLLPDGDDAGLAAAQSAYVSNRRLTVGWRGTAGGDPASDWAELVGERVAILESEGAAEMDALCHAWRERVPQPLQQRSAA